MVEKKPIDCLVSVWRMKIYSILDWTQLSHFLVLFRHNHDAFCIYFILLCSSSSSSFLLIFAFRLSSSMWNLFNLWWADSNISWKATATKRKTKNILTITESNIWIFYCKRARTRPFKWLKWDLYMFYGAYVCKIFNGFDL